MLKKDFFNPRSIAVIGASIHHQKIGFSVLKNIIDGGFQGKIYPINLDADEILTYKCYPSVLSVKQAIDMAVIVVPAPVVPKVMAECGKKGILNIIIISAGFAESGEEGKELQRNIKEISSIYQMNVLGPNCLGLIDPVNKLNVSFATNLPQKKDIAVISQSGATCTAILDWANEKQVGFSHFVSLGNKMDLNENDFLEYFEKDEHTKVVIGYLESISDGEKFLKLAKRLTAKKPFVLLKAGKTDKGQKAASSHTGALATDDQVIDIAFKEAGIIRADSLEDIFEWAMTFSNIEVSPSGEVLVVTNAGGPAVMATDAIASSKVLEFFSLNKNQIKILENKLPYGASISNPVDLLGDATSERFELLCDILKENEPDYKIIILTPQVNTDIEKIAKVIATRNDKKTLVVLIGGKKFDEAKQILAKAKIPVYLYPERAVKALDVLVEYKHNKALKEQKPRYIKGFRGSVQKIIKKEVLNDSDMAKILSAYHIPMADSYLTLNVDEALTAAEKVGYPVVLKVTSPDILHKTEIGAVKLGIEDEKSLRESYKEVLENAKEHFPEADILGVTVYKMVRSKIEVAIGAKRDPIFGPVIMFGMGGIYIELLKDYQLALAPVSIKEAGEMIKKIRSFEMLNGYRNGEKFDIEAIAKALSGLSALMLDFPMIKEVDVNPIRVAKIGEGIMALDAKIIFEKKESLVK